MPFKSSFKPFSLLVTGAPGWLCDAMLSRLGRALPALTRVRCLIQRGTPKDLVATWCATQSSVTEIIDGDLLDTASLEAAVESMSGGVVFHAAATFQPKKISDFNAVNRDGTLALAGLAKKAGVRRFIFISSTAAQGASQVAGHILTEAMPCRPDSHYGKSKHAAETGLMLLHEPGKFDVVILRPGPIYGLPVPAHHVELFRRIKQGRASLMGGGKFARSWSYINDVAAIAVTSLTHPDAAGEIFNVCDSLHYTQRYIYEAAAAALNVELEFRRVPHFAASLARFTDKMHAKFDRYTSWIEVMGDQNRHTGMSSEKAQRVLGFSPQETPLEGLKSAVEWCYNNDLLDD